jgi:hypothetical protein
VTLEVEPHVVVRARARVDTDGTLVAGRVVAAVVERGLREFEEHPVLRVGHIGLAVGHAEETRVEVFDVVEYRRGGNEVGVIDELRRRAELELLLAREPADRLDARGEVGPEPLRVTGPGHAAGQPDQGDRFNAGVLSHRGPPGVSQ